MINPSVMHRFRRNWLGQAILQMLTDDRGWVDVKMDRPVTLSGYYLELAESRAMRDAALAQPTKDAP